VPPFLRSLPRSTIGIEGSASAAWALGALDVHEPSQD
jgi:hypothetical protein